MDTEEGNNAPMGGAARTVQVVFVGDCGVGKSTFIAKYVRNHFTTTYAPTMGVEFDFTSIDAVNEGEQLQLQVWDTSGHERFQPITRAMYNGCSAAVVVFDVTNLESFDHLIQTWVPELQTAAPKAVVSILGTKLDLANADHGKARVPVEAVREYAEANGVNYLGDFALNEVQRSQMHAAVASAVGIAAAWNLSKRIPRRWKPTAVDR